MWHDDRDDETEPAQIVLHHGQSLPRDAERLGLDRNTEEGAMIAMAGSLSPVKLSHRVIAWVIVSALVLPLVWTILSLVF